MNGTRKRVYEIGRTNDPHWPLQMLCDAQIKNNRRHIVLSSIIRVINNTTLPLVLLDVDPKNSKVHNLVSKIDVNQDFHLPIDILYKHSAAPLFFSVNG